MLLDIPSSKSTMAICTRTSVPRTWMVKCLVQSECLGGVFGGLSGGVSEGGSGR